MGGIADQKAQQRAQLLAARRAIPHGTAAVASSSIAARLLDLPSFVESGAILLYCPTAREVDTDALRRGAEERRLLVYYPRVRDEIGNLEFVRVSPGEQLIPGAWGVREPSGMEIFRPGSPGLLVVPGVGFDRHGARLGRGRGSYDRAVRMLRPPVTVAGLAYGVQIVPALPRADWDESVDLIVTEHETLWCGPRRRGARCASAT